MFNLRNYFKICTKLHKLPFESRYIQKITSYRNFQTSSIRGKAFHNYENEFAHKVLENNELCRVLRGEQKADNYLDCEYIILNQKWELLNADNFLLHFKMIGSYCENNGLLISDERFDSFVDVFTERCFDFTDDQLIKSLQILSSHYPLTDSTNSRKRNFVELWNALDDACVGRIDQWDFNQILYICDHWHMLGLARINHFNKNASVKIGKKIRKLSPHQLVQTMFYVNLRRRPLTEMFEIETNLVKSIGEISLNEIAVICMGFFKSQTKLMHEDLVSKIIERLIREMDTVEDIALVCILKSLRYSSKIVHANLINQLFEAANDQISRLSPFGCLHLALLGTTLHICHRKCVDQIVGRFINDVKTLRVKDFERIAYVLGIFDFESENRIENELCEKMLLEMKNRVDEVTKHPRCLPLCLDYLTMKGYHDDELINVVLSQKYLSLCYGNLTHYGREILNLHCYAQINLKDTYKGNVLTEKNVRYMGKMFSQYIPVRDGKWKLSATDTILLDIKETSEKSYNHSYFAHALPHFDRPDVIIAYDKNTKSGIDIGRNFPELYTGKIIDRTMLIEGLNMKLFDVEIINFIVGGWNNYERDTNKLNGLIKLKVEQSKIIGLRPVLIPWFEWTRLRPEEQQFYIKHKINNELQQE